VHACFSYAQQISTNNSLTPQQLIQDLVGSDCATANNVSSSINGNVNNITSYGSFSSGTSNFPLENGIILSTGRISSAGNTFNGGNLSEGEINWTTDADIENILGINQTLNATSIEFDFASANNFISFKYLFASDEYQQDYPCNFKDVFAILIKRAGTADPYVNIAIVPETVMEVSTHSIRPDIHGFCEAQNDDYFQGYNIGSTNFNGQTNVLTATSDIIPNETYHIKFVIADHIDERFDSAVFIDAEGFGSSIDLGPDQSICGSDLTLNADIDNMSAIYKWFLNSTPIAGETNPTLEVNQSGNYTVEIEIPSPSGNCTLTDSIDIEIILFQPAAPIDDINICDEAPSDGLYDFDFPLLKNDEIFNNLPSTNYNISYHLSEEDAQNNSSAIVGAYQNIEASETIFVRIESLSGDCLQLGSFNISVSASPNFIQINSIYIYDGYFTANSNPNETPLPIGGGTLEYYAFEIANFEFTSTVTYYLNQNDASTSENAINNPSDIPEGTSNIIAKITDDINGCSSYTTITIEDLGGIDRSGFIDIFNACLTADEEFATFQLFPAFQQAIELWPTYLGKFYPTEQDAINETNVIDTAFITYTMEVPYFQIAYLRLDESPDLPYLLVPIRLYTNILFYEIGEMVTMTRCDDNTDRILDFDLEDVTNELKGEFDFEFTFYETELDRENEINPIDQLSPYTVNESKVVYVTANYRGCTHDFRLFLNVIEPPTLLPQTAIACGDYNLENDTTTILLEQFDELILQGIPTDMITYYLTEQDAINEENELGDTYDVSGNSQRFYIKVKTRSFDCSMITTLDVTIPSTIELNPIAPLIACDDDNDGFAIINLEPIIPTLLENPENYDISFYTSVLNALSGEFEISNPTDYLSQDAEIFVRVQLLGLDCFVLTKFEIKVFDNPQVIDISDYINCTIDINNHEGFFFESKDFETLNGQTNMQVRYFETQNNAIDGIGDIDKTIGFQNTSNPQTIYVRLENEAQNSCYKIEPMQIEVRQAPIYNQPTDVFECDANSTGLATTDLNEKIAEISAGSATNLNISFHLTPLNASVGSNAVPLNYTATSNPQLIYARVENINSGCVDTPTFFINVLSLPEVNFEQSLIACGNNYNFSPEWNLTDIELQVIEGRQYGIDYTYFESEADLFADTDAIPNPEAYVNTSNPQTIFLRVRNTITGCFAAVPFELLLNTPPIINEFETYNICDNVTNSVDLLDINTVLLENTFNVLVSYHTTLNDAENRQNPLNTDYVYTDFTENLFGRAEFSTTGCYVIYPFTLNVNPLPIANQPDDLIACDDDFDGFSQFDLTQQNIDILESQNPDDFTISFHHTEQSAVENNEPLDAIYSASNNETIFVRLEHNGTRCYSITQFSVVLNPIPFINIEDQVICLNDLPLLVFADTGNPLDSYLWSTNATTSEIEILETGIYSVTITNEFGCEYTSSFLVTESESATIDVVETIDFSDPNNITVTVNGIGNYLYQLNDLPFQTSNTFENVPIGYNTITIIDQNGCEQITREVLVIDVPKHLTPNGDGDFDTWHITGVETLPGTVIHIFDRYGKLLKELGHNSDGWNGTFNGNKMPAGDYWYIADVMQDGKVFQIKGHFTLRR
jgi:gliding motility-associated-like protein